MNIAIIGGKAEHLKILDDYLMNLIETSGNYLFTVIGGYVGSTGGDPPLSQLWAKKRGLPFSPKKYKDVSALMKGISADADYIIFLNDGSQIIRRFIMTYRQLEKHGSVINI